MSSGCCALRDSWASCSNSYAKAAEFRDPLQGDGHILEVRDARGCTPLHWAAKLGNVEVIKLLIAEGADVCARDHSLTTPLHYAVVSPTCHRLKSTTALLVEPGAANPNVQDANGQTPLHWLAGACHLSVHLGVIQVLMKHGAQVHMLDNNA